MLKTICLVLSLCFLCGCIVYKDRNGVPAPESVVFDCDQKCGKYDSSQNPIGVGHCIVNCMSSKGYRQ